MRVNLVFDERIKLIDMINLEDNASLQGFRGLELRALGDGKLFGTVCAVEPETRVFKTFLIRVEQLTWRPSVEWMDRYSVSFSEVRFDDEVTVVNTL